jgi:hypothetical protein
LTIGNMDGAFVVPSWYIRNSLKNDETTNDGNNQPNDVERANGGPIHVASAQSTVDNAIGYCS